MPYGTEPSSHSVNTLMDVIRTRLLDTRFLHNHAIECMQQTLIWVSMVRQGIFQRNNW